MKSIILIFILLTKVDSKLLLWTSQNLNLPALKHYKTENFQEIMRELNDPPLVTFQTDLNKIPKYLKEELNLKSFYLPNADINFEKFQPIEHSNNVDNIKEIYDTYKNPLIVFEEKSKRSKRFTPRYTGVLYQSQGIMLYTTRPPVLRQDTIFFVLDRCLSVESNVYPRTAVIEMEYEIDANLTISLEFKLILMYSNEWMLVTTKLTDANGDTYLTPNIDVLMKNKFSFHCSYDIVFRDMENIIGLVFRGLQIQPNCENGAFSAAIECMSYVTPSTIAALFVGVLFFIGLFTGINALLSIKTMDKFDNAKLKQLHLEDIHE